MIAIIAILIGLLLPAVQKVREAASRISARTTSSSSGWRAHNYHDAHGKFPPGAVGPLTPAFPQYLGLKHHGLGTYLLPYLEQQRCQPVPLGRLLVRPAEPAGREHAVESLAVPVGAGEPGSGRVAPDGRPAAGETRSTARPPVGTTRAWVSSTPAWSAPV